MTQPPSDWPSLVIAIEHADPVDLYRLTDALAALSDEYEKHLRRVLPTVEPEETRLLISDVRKGSTIIEVYPQLAWIQPFIPSQEKVMATLGFVKNLKDLMGPYFKQGERNASLSASSVKNLHDLAAVIAQDPKGSLSFTARTDRPDGSVEQFKIEKLQAQTAIENLSSERLERERKEQAQHPKVLLVFQQTKASAARMGKPTGDLGIVESIDTKPHKVVYVSQLAGDQIKAQIKAPGQNPYEVGFIVDVNVETVGGRPKAYRVMALHEVIDLSDDGSE